MNVDDPYEVANCEFRYGLGGPEKMAEMKLKWDLFQTTRNKFYKLNGRQLDGLFVLDGDPTGATTSEGDGDEESGESEKESESVEDDRSAPAEGTEDVEMGEVTGVVGPMDA